jgi:hypothetical protein
MISQPIAYTLRPCIVYQLKMSMTKVSIPSRYCSYEVQNASGDSTVQMNGRCLFVRECSRTGGSIESPDHQSVQEEVIDIRPGDECQTITLRGG